MQTNTSFVKIIRKQQEKPRGFQPKAKANKSRHIDKRDIWSDTNNKIVVYKLDRLV